MEIVTLHSPAEAKLALFASRFRGRGDAWARRYVARASGRVGYAPVCANLWRLGLCGKPKQSCASCSNRCFTHLTEENLLHHLRGADEKGKSFAVAVYPLCPGDTCFFATCAVPETPPPGRPECAAPARAHRLLVLSLRLGVPALLERTARDAPHPYRLWWFFAEALPATLARSFVFRILGEALSEDTDLGLDLYDAVHPSQGFVPKIGLGSYVPLPLQGEERLHGHSVFLDETLNPEADPWTMLSSVPLLSRETIETMVREGKSFAPRQADDEAPDFLEPDVPCFSPEEIRRQKEAAPDGIHVLLDNRVRIPLTELTPAFRNHLVHLATFVNPEFEKADRMRTGVYGLPCILSAARFDSFSNSSQMVPDYFSTFSSGPEKPPLRHLSLPRGCLEQVQETLRSHGIPVLVEDARESSPNGARLLSCTFQGMLRPIQKEAGEALLKHDTGVLSAGTAFGKTVMAAWLIAQRGVSTLVLVNRRQLQVQWAERLSTFLGLPPRQIGRIGGGGRRRVTGRIDIAVVQSLRRGGEVDELVSRYGFVIVDECHGLPAPTFAQVVDKARARYVLGLSATPVRRDGHHPVISQQCGPVRFRIDPKELTKAEPFAHVVVVRPTSFRLSLELEKAAKESAKGAFCAIGGELLADGARNRMLVDDVLAAVEAGRSPVVLTDRKAHLDILEAALAGKVAHVVRLQGGMGRRRLEEVRRELSEIPEDEARALLATGPFLGEGFDDARLDTLFLAMPVSWKGRIAQYAGRLHRRHEGKREVRIYDYADLGVKTLERMFNRRCEGYEAIGYRIRFPATEIPGWPKEVAVPVEPRWHETYAESVRRLCRDGVDEHLAQAFVDAAWVDVPVDAEGWLRARSKSEAFLWLRLETLPATRARFRLNAEVDIPFGPMRVMEVDFLDAERRVVVELDGPRHFRSEDDYRHDRLKDRLLQERGYRVLRFLSSDVHQRLPDVLDAILATLRI